MKQKYIFKINLKKHIFNIKLKKTYPNSNFDRHDLEDNHIIITIVLI